MISPLTILKVNGNPDPMVMFKKGGYMKKGVYGHTPRKRLPTNTTAHMEVMGGIEPP
jgi:hypothetical protein